MIHAKKTMKEGEYFMFSKYCSSVFWECLCKSFQKKIEKVVGYTGNLTD